MMIKQPLLNELYINDLKREISGLKSENEILRKEMKIMTGFSEDFERGRKLSKKLKDKYGA